MVDKPRLALLNLFGSIHDLLKIFAGRFAFFDLVGRDLKIVLLFLKVFNFALDMTLGPASVAGFYLLPVWIIEVETCLSIFGILNQSTRLALH